MVETDHQRLSIARQCELLSIARSSFYRTACGESEMNLTLMRLIDEQFMECPWYGSRQMAPYIQMKRGFLYLVAVMDWASRKVRAWRLSNTMDADFCVAALEEAIACYGVPEIFNTDQGSQFTSFAFTDVLKANGIRISMDGKGKGRWMDNVFIERLWRSLKYECVFLNAFETGSEARTGIGRWINYYNADRPHSAFDGRTPDEVYAIDQEQEKLAA
jgi:putative transposase